MNRKTLAYTLPFLVFMGLHSLGPFIKIDNPELPWWRHSPEQWIYPLQTVACLVLLGVFWRYYTFGKPKMLTFSVVVGLFGIAIWIAPAALGWQDRSEGGFDPALSGPAFLALRFFRLVVIVPFVEEIFWRGFLMRFLIDSPKNWHDIPLGTYAHRSFWIVVLMVGVTHWGPDFWVALIWGVLVGFLTVKAKNLWAPILAHAVANLALGIYIMTTKSWGFW